ncbi:MAG: DUF3341 domain-containing protein [Acidobacteriota bacterium]
MKGVLGIFEDRDHLLDALRNAPAKGWNQFETFSPYPDQELYELTAPGKSPVRWMTLLGAVTGAVSGLALTIWTTLQWPLLITGGKPLISLPPFLIIVFELTILFGALATVGGFLYWGVLRHLLNPLPYDSRFSQDKFGLWVECSDTESSQVVEWFQQSGATEWTEH